MANNVPQNDEIVSEVNQIFNKFEDSETSQLFMSIFDSIQEGIEIVDATGFVRYVNPAFETILGIKAQYRIGKNIIELVPEGTLAKVLKTRRALMGKKLHIPDAHMDIIVNTSPIFVNGKMVGAVAIFQGFSEVSKLVAQLNHSKKMVEDLCHKLSTAASAKYSFDDIIGQSRAIKRSIDKAKRFADTEATVMLLGETGTGKELFAHAIHQASLRNKHPFVKLNCAAIPESLLESELFGYEKGAFTGATQRKLGMFELAMHGTIFLDEIGELELQLQSKLLRVLEEGEMYRVGGTKPVAVNVRIIAATNRTLYKLVQEGRFREDLYYRLNVITIEIPPLRHRIEDIPLLSRFYIKRFNRKHGKLMSNITPTAEQLLLNYNWPGNIRELKNIFQQAVIIAEGREITANDLESLLKIEKPDNPLTQLIPLQEMERHMILTALEQYGCSLEGKKKAAKALNISLRTLYNKIQKYKLNDCKYCND